MKENINSMNFQVKSQINNKKLQSNLQSKKQPNNKKKQQKVHLKPSELLLKKQKNEIPPNLQNKQKIIELQNTKDISDQISSNLPLNVPLFEAIPPVVIFSDYEALKVKTQVLRLRNRDTVARRVKVIQPETNLFQVSQNYQKDNQFNITKSNKIAPGLDFTFEIKFAPESKTDYKYELIIVTEREKFIIPIIAIGKKPLIVFPDTINFGNSCPVKYFTEKPVIIHNKGEKVTKWEIKLPDNFYASKEAGILGEKCSEQIVIKFYPNQRKYYNSSGLLYYDGDVAQFELLGNAINGEVYLSKNYIQQEETYISLESRDSFKIVNKSSVKISFEWRAFQSEKEEKEKKQILLDQIEKEEQEKKILIYDTLDLEENMNILQNSNNNDLCEIDNFEEKEILIKKRKKAEMLLDRKYKAIKKAILEDTLGFEDDIFSIQPISGSIWPNSEMTITVIFKPKAALKYLHQAYCNISCSDQRLPLYLEGEGLGPKAFLSTNSLSINDIFVNDKQYYNIYIENKGEIPAKFKLQKNKTTFSQMISFDIEEAELEVGQRMNIIMTFQSQKVGEFQELFKWELQGSTEVLSLLVRGHVQAPKFEFSKKIIDYQKVSYHFEKIEEIELTNISTVPFNFGLRIPQDGKGELREFEIVPSQDQILPNETKKIKIKFVPHFRKVYKNVMVLDIDGIGKDMKSVPILAESLVPKVKVSPQVLNFGDIFLRYQQTQKLQLINESDLHARFIVHKLSSKYEQYGQIITDLDKGQISPRGQVQINITLITTCIKAFEMDFVIEIVSDMKTQHLIKVTANSIGPIVELSKKEINFGDVDVLTKKTQTITLTNKSEIPADFFAFTKNKNSIFRPVQKRYVLKPQESFDVDIICYADDQQKFQDILFFVIKEGVDKEVILKARGVGSTIFCKEIKNINFGTLYTHKAVFQEIFLENKGRRTQNLRWQRKIEKKEENQQQILNVFTIYPDVVSLPPKTGLMFQFKAFSTSIGQLEESYQLTSSIGTERKTNNILSSTIKGQFIKPQLQFSKKNMEFVYIWKEDEEPQIISQNLEIICACPLPTMFTLHVEQPFEVYPKQFSLLPKKSGIVRIDFNPALNQSKISNKISEKILIKHNKNPKNETFEIKAEFCYPNLKLDQNEIDFGAVMNDTSKKIYIKINNCGIIPVDYEWFFVDDGQQYQIPINEVFDILPLRGRIEPGLSEQVEFSYYAVPFNSFKLTAVCKTKGGPEYFVKINAEASDVAYNVNLPKNKNFIDFGDVFISQKLSKIFELQNQSKVAFEYQVRLDSSGLNSSYMKKFITINPFKGTLKANENINIRVTMIPGFPNLIQEHLILQVAHFEPEKICIKANGIFPSLKIDIPRQQNLNIKNFMITKMGFQEQQLEHQWTQIFENISNESIIQIEKNIIKNHVKKNLEKILCENLNQSQSSFSSKKFTTKKTTIQVSSKSIQSQRKLEKQISTLRRDLDFIKNVILGTYIIDMGTVIAGNKAQKTFKIYNIGKTLLSLEILNKTQKQNGIQFSVSRINKLSYQNNNSIEITVTLNTKKNSKAEPIQIEVPLQVKDGGQYIILIQADINVPELSVSQDLIQFEQVLVGHTKIATIRLINEKVIPCQWSINQVPLNLSVKEKKKISQMFFVEETSGYLDPKTSTNIKFRFEPHENFKYEQKFIFSFKDSNKKLELNLKGEGIIPQIQFIPDKINFNACLPNEIQFQTVKIINLSNFDLSLYLPNISQQFLDKFSIFQQYNQNYFFKKTRQFGEKFWQDIQQDFEIKSFNNKIDQQIKDIQISEEQIENKEELIRNLLLQKKPMPIKYKQIRPVKFENQINIIFYSEKPKLCESVSLLISQKHSKKIINLNELLDWHYQKNTQIGQQIKIILEENQLKLEQLLNEQKKKGKKSQPINEQEIMYLNKDQFKQLLQIRIQEDDCQAGIIITLISNNLISIEQTIEVLLEIFQESNLYIFELTDYFLQDQSHVINQNLQNEENINEQKNNDQNQTNKFQMKILDFMNNENNNLQESFIQEMGYSQQVFQRQSIIFDQFNRIDDISDLEQELDQYQQIKQYFQKLNSIQDSLQQEIQDLNEQENSEQLQNNYQQENISNLNFKNIKYFIVPFPQNFLKLNFSIVNFLPQPIFIKPQDLPLPQNETKQVLKQTQQTRQIQNLKYFSIYDFKSNENLEEEINEENHQDLLNISQNKWFIGKNDFIYICIKFSSDQIGEFKENLIFETENQLWNSFYKGYKLQLQAQTILPEFDRNMHTIFNKIRKQAISPKGLYYKRCYLQNEQIYTFGSLLLRANDEPNVKKEYWKKIYTQKLFFKNNSPFAIKMNFQLEQIELEEEQVQQNKKSKKQPEQMQQFSLSMNQLIIQQDENCFIEIEAFPQKVGEFKQNLICIVENNPKNLIIPLHFIGEIPKVQIDQNFLDFDKIIINKSITKSLQIKNNCLVNIKWKIKNLEELVNQDFQIENFEGILKVNQQQQININFKAQKANKIEKNLYIEVQDNENRNIFSQNILEVKLQAEGFEILVDFNGFDQQDQMLLDFGTTLVQKKIEKKFQVLNKGLYPIDFDLMFLDKNSKENFVLEPKQFQLNSGEQKNITMIFQSKKEVLIKAQNEKQNLIVRILEKKSQEIYNQIKIPIQATSHFSKFIVNPKKSLNFGPINFQEQRKRTFEIINQGTFKFEFELFNLKNKELHQEIIKKFNNAILEEQISNKNQKKNNKDNLDLKIDQFIITPKQGIIQPGSSCEIEVTFIGSDNDWHEEKLGIEISNRDFNNENEQEVYLQLIGESCIPSIETKDFRSIFEEQVVTESLNSMGVNIQNIIQGNVFSIEDKTFYFGNLIPSKYPNGLTEKFKLINNGKVKVELNLEIQTKNNSLQAFQIEPKSIQINPHEYSFAQITFKPEIMSIYEATFISTVQFKDKINQKNQFIFDIKGEGILPTLRILNDQKDVINFGKIRQNKIINKFIALKNNGLIPATANCLMKNQNGFRLVSQNQKTIMPQEICQFEIEFQPQQKGQFKNQIEFQTCLNPFEVNKLQLIGEGVYQKVSCENLDENETLNFGDLLLNPEQNGNLCKKYFILKNYSNEMIRFEWENLSQEYDWIKIVPNIGHLGPKMEKKIRVYLIRPKQEKTTVLNIPIKANLQVIQLELTHNILKIRQWDSTKKIKKMVTEKEYEWYLKCQQIDEEFKKVSQKNPKAKKQQYPEKPNVEESDVRNREIKIKQEEPQYNTIEKIDQDLQVNLKAKIDIPKLHCSTSEIYFQKTDMFCSRVINVQIENKSCIDLQYNCELFDQYFGVKDNGYFEVIPNEGIITKESIKDFIIKFSPIECDQFKINRILIIKILNSQVSHQIILKGEVERPMCHFEIPFQISDNKEKIIEIETLGYKNQKIYKFYILNPTALSYDFIWNFDNSVNSFLKCLTPKGTIYSGKKYECQFEFCPSKNCPDKIQKLFEFKIPQFNIKHNFLIKAMILQPKLFFSQPKIDFGPLLLSGKGRETIYLKNLDNTSYNFSFQRQSIKGASQSHYNCLQVQPLSGQIGPQQDFAIQLSFNPKCETNFNYNLICNVKSKKQPLTLNVKGIGYKLKHQIVYKKRVLSQHFLHQINFQDIYVNETKKQSIILENNGDFNFEFQLQKKQKNYLSIEPESGTVKKKEKQKINLIFKPKSEVQFNTKIKLIIQSGPTYQFQLTGKSLLPQISIKPSIINFGNVLVTNNLNIITKELKVINNDNKTLILDKDFEKNDFLSIKPILGESVLPYNNNKNNILKVPVQLNLKKIGKFFQKVEFKINGDHIVEVQIKGEGVSLDLELENPSDSLIDFGHQKIGQQICREIKVFNNSKVPIHLNFDTNNQLKKFYDSDILIDPLNLYIPQKSFEILRIVFNPKKRIRNFQFQLQYCLQNSNDLYNLLQIKGACYAIEVKLMEENIDFQSVVINSSLSKKFNLINLGDLNAEFNWDLGNNKQYFQITPSNGILMSNQRLAFEAVFKPISLNQYKAIAKLNIKNSQQQIKLSLQGLGVSTPPEAIKTLDFESPVRETQTKIIQLKNTSDNYWVIYPNINYQNEITGFFQTQNKIEIESGQTKDIKVEFKPFLLQPEIQKATLFLPLNNGNAIVYNLQGIVQQPNPEETFEINLKAKEIKKFGWQIKNWLQENQRLQVSFEQEDKQNLLDNGIIIHSGKTIDLTHNQIQQYNIQIYVLKQGQYKINCYFKNLKNNEYLYYQFNLNASESSVQKQINLTSFVREKTVQNISIENPLSKNVIIQKNQIQTDFDLIQIENNFPIEINSNFEQTLKIAFRPLIEFKEKKIDLKINSNELGIFKYQLILKSKKSQVIPTLNFKAKIGSYSTKTFNFQNYLTKPSTYICSIRKIQEEEKEDKQADFIVQQNYQAQPAINSNGQIQNLEIKFEPSKIGSSKSLLNITNQEGGTFQAFLIGHSQPSLPKGPFKINQKGHQIEFKNPFFYSQEFNLTLDNSEFIMNQKPVVKLEGKKILNISIQYKPNQNNNTNGRLIIENKDGIQWVFYLLGIKNQINQLLL